MGQAKRIHRENRFCLDTESEGHSEEKRKMTIKEEEGQMERASERAQAGGGESGVRKCLRNS